MSEEIHGLDAALDAAGIQWMHATHAAWLEFGGPHDNDDIVPAVPTFAPAKGCGSWR